MEIHVGSFDPLPVSSSQFKRRKISLGGGDLSSSTNVLRGIEASLPTLRSSDYYMEPCLSELATRELLDPGYCSRVQDFTVGRFGYGSVKFIGKTDVRWLDLDQIIKFGRHEVVVYEDENMKPEVGQGLNKAAEVTLLLQIRTSADCKVDQLKNVVKKLRLATKRQRACFMSFDPLSGEWKFSVHHFSRFGLSDDDEEDITMDDATPEVHDQTPLDMDGDEVSEIDEETAMVDPALLSHSLPAHLGLDPVKMRDMRMLMFPTDEEEVEENAEEYRVLSKRESTRSPLLHSSRTIQKSSPPVPRKMPLALLEYNPGNFGSSSPGSILMAQQNKGLSLKTTKAEGFKLDLKHGTPETRTHSRNVVDAALFMGRSFRVGWGPNGVLVHTGAPIGSSDSHKVLSSVVNLEKVAIDKVVTDENKKIREELIDYCFDSPLSLHKEMNKEIIEIGDDPFKLKLQKLVCDRVMLSEVCRNYIGIIERKLEVPGLTSSARVGLMHQVMVWELIKVLFSLRETRQSKPEEGDDHDDDEDMIDDRKVGSPEVDPEALPLIRRAEFSYWLQESVCHRVQDEVGVLSESSYLEQIFLYLTGRQLEPSVELAASKGDVRLAMLLSQAGGSTVSRSDISQQLHIWRINGMDFDFIEKERLNIFELLSGNIHGALNGMMNIDWKRFLGLLMWYHLPPETPLPELFNTYQKLLADGKAPHPVPVYIDEAPVEESVDWSEKHFDLAYYLMLLHASKESNFGYLKTMLSAFASTHDPLDYHMIWHQRGVLEAAGTFSSNDLHLLDVGLISQLLSVGQCHWAIYVALHMPQHDDYPYLQATVIREILFQYCESWSSQESQRRFIEELGIPSAWMHEALAVFHSYFNDLPKALEHYLECGNWHKAHSIFVTSVAHSLFLSAKHTDIWRITTSMEDYKSEIENWDLGAGIYISYYLLKESLQEDKSTASQQDTLENKNDACRDFIGRLNESLAVWGNRLRVDARVAYSKMGEEICDLLLSGNGENSTRDAQLSCFDTVFRAPLPEDRRACHLQDAVSLFTCYLSETAS